MTEIQGKSILVRVSARFELARVRVIGSRLYIKYANEHNMCQKATKQRKLIKRKLNTKHEAMTLIWRLQSIFKKGLLFPTNERLVIEAIEFTQGWPQRTFVVIGLFSRLLLATPSLKLSQDHKQRGHKWNGKKMGTF